MGRAATFIRAISLGSMCSLLLLTAALFLILVPSPVSAGEVTTNTHGMAFSIESDLKTMCPAFGKEEPDVWPMYNRFIKRTEVSVSVLCEITDGENGTRVLFYASQERTLGKFLGAMMSDFATGETDYSLEVVEDDIFSQFSDLPSREIELVSWKQVQLPYEELVLGSGEKVDIFHVVLYINEWVYRNHAVARVEVNSEGPMLWIVFMNRNNTEYRGVDTGKNDPVRPIVAAILSGVRLTN